MKLYLIRHAATRQNSQVDATQWHLTPEGEQQTDALAKHPLWDEVDCIILSGEQKTHLTVAPVVAERNLPTWVEGRFNELRRGGWVEDYTAHVAQAFAHPREAAGEWESASAALNRFLDGIGLLRKRFVNENLALVGHGLTFSLYRAYLLGHPNVKLEDWQQLPFASVALVNPISERLIHDFVPVSTPQVGIENRPSK